MPTAIWGRRTGGLLSGVSGEHMSPVGQGHCGWPKWGMVGEEICTVPSGATAEVGGNLLSRASVSHADST
jgi:hypothetical protein